MLPATAPNAPRPEQLVLLRRLARAGAFVAGALGILVLAGWAGGSSALTRVAPGLPAMVPNTAVMMISCAVVVAGEAGWRWGQRLRTPLVLLVTAISALTLTEYVGGIDLGIDRLLGESGGSGEHPGRPSPHTAAAFLMLSLALGTARRQRGPGARLASVLATGAATVVAGALIGYVLDTEQLRGTSSVVGISLPTLAGLTVLTVALFALRPDAAPASWYARRGAGEAAARRVMPAALVVPLLIGAAVTAGMSWGWWDGRYAVALAVLAMAVSVQLMTALSVRQVRAHEARRWLVERESRAQRRRFETLSERAPVGIFEADAAGACVYVNERWCELSGMTADETLGDGWLRAIHPDDRDRIRAGLDIDALQGEDFSGEFRFERSDTDALWVMAHATALRDDDGHAYGLIASALDISERKRSEHDLRFMSEHDVLTGLPNRRRLSTDLARRIGELKRYGHGFALVILDLDRFKPINDTLGHRVGDEVLQAVAVALRSRLRETDLVARLGGDEFACVIGEADPVAARTVTAELLESIRNARVSGIERELPLSASAGLICADTLADPTEASLLAAADLAMYAAKSAGRDRWAAHTSDGTGRAQRPRT